MMPPPVKISDTKPKGLQTISIDQIIPNRLQPRTTFDDEKIRDLAN